MPETVDTAVLNTQLDLSGLRKGIADTQALISGLSASVEKELSDSFKNAVTGVKLPPLQLPKPDTSFTDFAKTLSQELRTLKGEFDSGVISNDAFKEGLNQTKNRLSELLGEATRGTKAYSDLASVSGRVSNELERTFRRETKERVSELANSVVVLQRRFTSGEVSAKELREELARQKGVLQAAAKEFKDNSLEQKRLENAAASAESALAQLRGETGRLTFSSRILTSIQAALGKEQDKLSKSSLGFSANLKTIGLNASRLGTNLLGAAGLSIGLGAVTTGLGKLVASAAAAQKELLTNAQSVGVTAEAYQELTFAFNVLGIPLDQLRQGLGDLNQRAGQAAAGSKSMQDSFARLGVSLTDTNGKLKDTDTLFFDVVDALSEIPSAAERTAAAGSVLGEEFARRVQPALIAGADEMRRLRDQAVDLGLVLSGDVVAKFADFKTQVDILGQSFNAVRQRAAAEFLPVFQDQIVPFIQAVLIPAIDGIIKSLATTITAFAGMSDEVDFTDSRMARFITTALKVGDNLDGVGKIIVGIGFQAASFGVAFVKSSIAIQEAITGQIRKLGDLGKVAQEVFSGNFKQAFETAKGIISPVTSELVGELQSVRAEAALLNSVGFEFVTRGFESFQRATLRTTDDLEEMGKRIDEARNLIGTFSGSNLDEVANSANSATDALSGVSDGAKNATKDVKSINDVFQDLEDTLAKNQRLEKVDENFNLIEANTRAVQTAINELIRDFDLDPASDEVQALKNDLTALVTEAETAKQALAFDDAKTTLASNLNFIQLKLKEGLITPLEAAQLQVGVYEKALEAFVTSLNEIELEGLRVALEDAQANLAAVNLELERGEILAKRQQIFSDLATAGTVSITLAALDGNTVEALLADLENRIGLLRSAREELLNTALSGEGELALIDDKEQAEIDFTTQRLRELEAQYESLAATIEERDIPEIKVGVDIIKPVDITSALNLTAELSDFAASLVLAQEEVRRLALEFNAGLGSSVEYVGGLENLESVILSIIDANGASAGLLEALASVRGELSSFDADVAVQPSFTLVPAEPIPDIDVQAAVTEAVDIIPDISIKVEPTLSIGEDLAQFERLQELFDLGEIQGAEYVQFLEDFDAKLLGLINSSGGFERAHLDFIGALLNIRRELENLEVPLDNITPQLDITESIRIPDPGISVTITDEVPIDITPTVTVIDEVPITIKPEVQVVETDELFDIRLAESLREAFDEASIQAEQFGDAGGAVSTKIRALESAITDLLLRGVDPASSAFGDLFALLKEEQVSQVALDLQGSIDTLNDLAGDTPSQFEELELAFLDAAAAGAISDAQLREYLDTLGKVRSETERLDKLGLLSDTFSSLSGTFSDVNPELSIFTGGLATTIDIGTKLATGDYLGAALDFIGELVGGFQAASEAAQKLQDDIAGINDSFNLIDVTSLIPTSREVVGSFLFIPIYGEVVNVDEITEKAFSALRAAVNPLEGLIAEAIKSGVSGETDWQKVLRDGAYNALLDGIIEAFINTAIFEQTLTPFFVTLGEQFKKALNGEISIDEIDLSGFENAIEFVITFLEEKIPDIRDQFPDDLFQGLGEDLTEEIQLSVNELITEYQRLTELAETGIRLDFTYNDTLNEVKNDLKEILSLTSTDFASALSSAFKSSTYEDFLADLGSNLESVVTNALIQSFLVSEAIQPLLDAISDAALSFLAGTGTFESIEALIAQLGDEATAFFELLASLGLIDILPPDIEEELAPLFEPITLDIDVNQLTLQELTDALADVGQLALLAQANFLAGTLSLEDLTQQLASLNDEYQEIYESIQGILGISDQSLTSSISDAFDNINLQDFYDDIYTQLNQAIYNAAINAFLESSLVQAAIGNFNDLLTNFLLNDGVLDELELGILGTEAEAVANTLSGGFDAIRLLADALGLTVEAVEESTTATQELADVTRENVIYQVIDFTRSQDRSVAQRQATVL